MAESLQIVENKLSFERVFQLDEGFGHKLNVLVTSDNDTGKPLSVSFSDPDRDQMVSVDWDLWSRVLAAIERATAS